jgi:hypothetical protein
VLLAAGDLSGYERRDGCLKVWKWKVFRIPLAHLDLLVAGGRWREASETYMLWRTQRSINFKTFFFFFLWKGYKYPSFGKSALHDCWQSKKSKHERHSSRESYRFVKTKSKESVFKVENAHQRSFSFACYRLFLHFIGLTRNHVYMAAVYGRT